MFSFYNDKRLIYIVLGILVLMGIMRFTQNDLLALILTLPGVIIAITFHEFAHAFVADRLGDMTPRNQGRLNLNPASHLDPTGFILLIFAHVGWGKPVQINPRNFDRNISMGTAEALVSVAGPVMNFILAIVFTIIYCILVKFVGTSFLLSQIGIIVSSMIQSTIIVNIGLGVFNLIPLPPLDGSKIFMNFMSYNTKRWIEEREHIFYYAFLILWITGLASMIISPIINVIYNGITWVVGLAFGMI